MAFLPKPGELIEDDESVYELSGDEDNRLRQEYELGCQISVKLFS